MIISTVLIFPICRMIFRALPERLSDAEIDEMLHAADTDGQISDYSLVMKILFALLFIFFARKRPV